MAGPIGAAHWKRGPDAVQGNFHCRLRRRLHGRRAVRPGHLRQDRRLRAAGRRRTRRCSRPPAPRRPRRRSWPRRRRRRHLTTPRTPRAARAAAYRGQDGAGAVRRCRSTSRAPSRRRRARSRRASAAGRRADGTGTVTETWRRRPGRQPGLPGRRLAVGERHPPSLHPGHALTTSA